MDQEPLNQPDLNPTLVPLDDSAFEWASTQIRSVGEASAVLEFYGWDEATKARAARAMMSAAGREYPPSGDADELLMTGCLFGFAFARFATEHAETEARKSQRDQGHHG